MKFSFEKFRNVIFNILILLDSTLEVIATRDSTSLIPFSTDWNYVFVNAKPNQVLDSL